MKTSSLVILMIVSGLCSTPIPLTATVDAQASIPHLGLVFRTQDRWFERHKMTDLGGCTIITEESAFACGDLAASESKTFSFLGVPTTAGSFHYELALRELVQPFDYVNDHPDGADAQIWDETVT